MTTATYRSRTPSAPGTGSGGGQPPSTADPTVLLRREQDTEVLRLRRRASRQNRVILGVASLVGIWLGVAAPAVTPVAPSAPTPASAASVGDLGSDTSTVPVPPPATGGGPR